MGRRTCAIALTLAACGTHDQPSDSERPPVVSDSSSGGLANGTTGGAGQPETGEAGTTGNTDTTGSTGVMFLVPVDTESATHECDIFAQDCLPGEKCMPWANDGSNSWNATRCSPVADNPGQPGDECTVEGSGVSGIDDCVLASMCWDVDPETNVGTCVAMCAGDEANPICEDPDTSCAIANEGVLVLCLPNCDPLLQACPDGQACYPIQQAWTCAPDASGEGGVYGDPCEFINVCDPGLICLGAAAVPPGEACEGAVGCCTEVCDLDDPAGDAQCSGQAGGQTCQPWYDPMSVPPGYEDVGACAMPA
ncbi:ribulose phosphate epimerase [Paraliomyxa miuraensis]|uniref:ribulose phosphate epimerase n=1 Tax=Paraliomyxa miuraensis TaxID=376150 RepID=UPI00224DA5AF|nr:ribulose phosphate epimerase [Paraliomyxa miuraensis]MCX4247247.1 ribulose phosphate epimerase [Paraliomyxa miuraensis]